MGVRGVGRLAGAGLLLVVCLPLFALFPASVIDRGPDGGLRGSPFPIALAVFDPFVWICVRNSALIGGMVAGGSLLVGLAVGIIAGRWRFWGRGLLWPLSLVAMLGGPLLIAPGVLILLGGDRAWDWLAARSLLGLSCEDLGRWFALAWVGIACGAPIVAMATVHALARVESTWSEAAQEFGATRWRAWRDVVWPTLRPDVARASASVFVLTLVEPAGPLILGLRRTLATQIVEAARRFDQPTRAVTLALLALGVAALGGSLIVLWGGSIATRAGDPIQTPPCRVASRGLGLAFVLILIGWAAASAGPLLASLRWAFADVRGLGSPSVWSSVIHTWMADAELITWAWNSLMAGTLAVALDLLILLSLTTRSPGARDRWSRAVGRFFRVIPPMVFGVGALAIPWLLVGIAGMVGAVPARWLGSFALELSPARVPGVLLVLNLAAFRLPMLIEVARLCRFHAQPALVDAARALGDSDRRAGQPRLVPIRVVILAIALTSTSLAPTLVLTPSSESRTLAPALLGLLLNPDGETRRAAGPIALILTVNLCAFAFASRWRVARPGTWFRG